MKKLSGLLFLAIICFSAQAQTALFNQQWYSRVNRNPAATASGSETLNLSMFYNAQWVGVDGAPVTGLINADAYFDKIKTGLGLSITYDEIGKSRSNFNILFSYAYRVDLNEDLKLSLGVAGGLMNMNNDPSKNNFGENNDPAIPTHKINEFAPDFNVGAEISFRKLKAGISMTHLLYGDAGDYDKPRMPRELYGYAQYTAPLSRSFELMPLVTWNYSPAYEENIFEMGAMASYHKYVMAGLNWKIDNAVAFMAGFEYSGLQLGYAYQLSVGDVSDFAKNSHELMLRIKINYKNSSK